ncbi:MAG: PilZ domain-containing protein [Hyphomicrobiales bacterium]
MSNSVEGIERTFGRLRLQEPAWVIGSSTSGGKAEECKLHDLSITGARLECAHAQDLPEQFDIYLHGETLPTPCRVSWRDGNLLGVVFQ